MDAGVGGGTGQAKAKPVDSWTKDNPNKDIKDMLVKTIDFPGRGRCRCVLFRKGPADEVDVDVECNMAVMYKEELGDSETNIRGQKGLDSLFGQSAGVLDDVAKHRGSMAEAARPDLDAVLEAVQKAAGSGSGSHDSPAAGNDAQPGQPAGIGGSDSDRSDDGGGLEGGTFMSSLLAAYGPVSSGGGGAGGGGSGKNRRAEKAATHKPAAGAAAPNKREKSAGAPAQTPPATREVSRSPGQADLKVCISRLTYLLMAVPVWAFRLRFPFFL